MTTLRITLLALTMTAALAAPAAAFDVTGTWAGTRKCQDLFGGTKEKFKEPATLRITQSGNEIGIAVEITGAGTTNYAGLANFPAAKPDKGEFAMIHCGTNDILGDDPAFDAIGRMRASTKTGKVKAKITGTSIFSDPGTATPGLGTCKWSLTRVDAGDPVVSTVCGTVVFSRRAYKKNVQYLSDADVKRLHDALLAFHLASWQYTMPGASPATHLGFIIDDVEPSPSIAESGNAVDLYGYASMAVAAVQTQAREIDELKAAVASLQKQVAKQR
jgi:hypothetical protein